MSADPITATPAATNFIVFMFLFLSVRSRLIS